MLTLNGLAKLIEEAGEVTQVAGKMIAYPDGLHPDGMGHLKTRLEDELADLFAASSVVAILHGLSAERIEKRAEQKKALFLKWHEDKEC